jgi:hypothetical protein
MTKPGGLAIRCIFPFRISSFVLRISFVIQISDFGFRPTPHCLAHPSVIFLPRMPWHKSSILRELSRLHKAGSDLSYNGLAKAHQALVSASAYHFGSYRRAVESAGIDYATVLRRPRWTRTAIVALIKSARRKGEKLHWSAVTRRRDELGRAAFASLQPRLFGQWDRALKAAGLEADNISIYRRWDQKSIARKLKQLTREGQAASSGAIQSSDPGLHAAAIRHFENFDAALRAANLNPEKIRQRQRWTKPALIRAIKSISKKNARMSDNQIRRHSPAIYGASIRLFGSFVAARTAAGIQFNRKRKN